MWNRRRNISLVHASTFFWNFTIFPFYNLFSFRFVSFRFILFRFSFRNYFISFPKCFFMALDWMWCFPTLVDSIHFRSVWLPHSGDFSSKFFWYDCTQCCPEDGLLCNPSIVIGKFSLQFLFETINIAFEELMCASFWRFSIRHSAVSIPYSLFILLLLIQFYLMMH